VRYSVCHPYSYPEQRAFASRELSAFTGFRVFIHFCLSVPLYRCFWFVRTRNVATKRSLQTQGHDDIPNQFYSDQVTNLVAFCPFLCLLYDMRDRLCGLVVRVLGYRSASPGSIPGTTRKKSSGSGTGSTQPREYN
jgi:hypothetical protein